jgi:hypothetical protein
MEFEVLKQQSIEIAAENSELREKLLKVCSSWSSQNMEGKADYHLILGG